MSWWNVVFALAGVLLATRGTAAEHGRELAMARAEWKLYLPTCCTHNPSGEVDLLVHFHGDPATVRRNVEEARLAAVVVTVNYNGLSSVYAGPFSDPGLFGELLDDALGRVRLLPEFGAEARWGRLAVSSFSAGYGAVRELLKSPDYREVIDGVLAADSLYASTDPRDASPVDEQMADYKRYADLAVAGEKVFILTHTEVPTPTYESTRDTADELLKHLGIEPEGVDQRTPAGLHFVRHARRGGFTLWGSPGATGEAHMEHLRQMAEWLDDLPLAKAPAP
jgi:hypothetical protein